MSKKQGREQLMIENAHVIFRNFSGKEGKFNPAGRRNFCVVLEEDVAAALEKDGWNVRYLEPRDEAEDPKPYIQVAVRYDKVPPKISLITEVSQTILDETNVGVLDWAEIQNVDLVVTPSYWEVNGKKGVKAYVKAMYVTIVEDEFERKYRNVPDSAANAVPYDDDDL